MPDVQLQARMHGYLVSAGMEVGDGVHTNFTQRNDKTMRALIWNDAVDLDIPPLHTARDAPTPPYEDIQLIQTPGGDHTEDGAPEGVQPETRQEDTGIVHYNIAVMTTSNRVPGEDSSDSSSEEDDADDEDFEEVDLCS